MSDRNRKTPPLPLLATELVGTLLTGFGLAEALAGTELMPQGLRFAHYGWVMVVIGVGLMLPMLVWTLRQIGQPQAVR